MDNKRLNKLRLAAEKCPVMSFKAFIGQRGTQALLCSETGMEIVGWSGFDSSKLTRQGQRKALVRYMAAAEPATILTLVAEVEAQKMQLEKAEATIKALREVVDNG